MQATTTETAGEARQRSTGELLKNLSEQVSRLARLEVELAKAELTIKARRAGVAGGELGGALLLALGAFGALTACLIAAIALELPVWAAALIVGAVYLLVAGGLALDARNRLRKAMPPAPEETMQSVKEDVRWARRQIS